MAVDPTDADLSAITEAELRNLEAEHAEHAGGAWGVLRHRWIWYSRAGWLIKALRACRAQSKAKDAVIEAARFALPVLETVGKMAATYRRISGEHKPNLGMAAYKEVSEALAALDKETGGG